MNRIDIKKDKDLAVKKAVETLKNGLLRVTIQSYANRNDALAALDSLRQAEPGNSYWLMAD